MENCKSCYRVCNLIPDCLTTLSIMTDQTDAELIVQLIDQHNNIYISEATTESSGLFVLDLSDDDIYPKALINPYSGQMKLIVAKDGEIVPFRVLNKDYDCLIFECAVTNPKESTYSIDVYGNQTGGY